MLCIDFANTVEWRQGAQRADHLTGFQDLVNWALDEGIVNASKANQILRQAEAGPSKANRTLQRAVTLREATYRIFEALAEGSRPKPVDLAVLNEELSRAMSRSRIVQKANKFRWEWVDSDEDSLESLLWPIARSAADFLTSQRELSRIKKCANYEQGCGWLFEDNSKNGSRRWCSMSSCGNRIKARRHYERQRRK